MKDGSTKEEWKMIVETKKMLDPKIEMTTTCVRVPVLSAILKPSALNLTAPFPKMKRAQPEVAPGVPVVDRREDEGYVTPIECVGEFETFACLRVDLTVPHGLNLWVVSDNLRKGAALNAVQSPNTDRNGLTQSRVKADA